MLPMQLLQLLHLVVLQVQEVWEEMLVHQETSQLVLVLQRDPVVLVVLVAQCI